MEKSTEKPLHGGHRQRLLERLKKEELVEHEYMEILLFNAMPRKNTNDLAHRLLSKFGSVEGVFSASMQELLSVDGVGENLASYLYCIGKFYTRYHRKQVEGFEGRYTPERFITFIRQTYEPQEEETAEVYLLDEGGYAIRKYEIDGGKDSVNIKPEKLTALIVEYSPAGIVIVHNHPMGCAEPSDKDTEMTKICQLICSAHNVIFCDHLIASDDGVFSYYLSGKLAKISHTFSVEKLLKSNETE